jgi:hypothetical protein
MFWEFECNDPTDAVVRNAPREDTMDARVDMDPGARLPFVMLDAAALSKLFSTGSPTSAGSP